MKEDVSADRTEEQVEKLADPTSTLPELLADLLLLGETTYLVEITTLLTDDGESEDPPTNPEASKMTSKKDLAKSGYNMYHIGGTSRSTSYSLGGRLDLDG